MSAGVGIWRCKNCGAAYFPERLLCPRCHGNEFEPDRVTEGVVEEVTVIRHVLGQENWQPRRIANVRTVNGPRITVGLRDEFGAGHDDRIIQEGDGAVRRRESRAVNGDYSAACTAAFGFALRVTPAATNCLDRVGRIAELAQDFLRMFAQHRRAAIHGRPIVVEQNRIAHRAHVAKARMLDVLHHAARDNLRVRRTPRLKLLTQAQGTPAFISAASISSEFHRADGRLDHRHQRVLVGLAAGVGGVTRIVDVRLEAEHRHQVLEQMSFGVPIAT